MVKAVSGEGTISEEKSMVLSKEYRNEKEEEMNCVVESPFPAFLS